MDALGVKVDALETSVEKNRALLEDYFGARAVEGLHVQHERFRDRVKKERAA